MSENELNKYHERMQGREPIIIKKDEIKESGSSDNGDNPEIE